MLKKLIVLSLLPLLFAFVKPQPPTLQIALLKYSGGGDWYAVVDALQNLSDFCNVNLGTNIEKEYATVEVGSAEIFSYPFIFMTGHGNVVFSDQEAENLRMYLLAGGFLFIDDDYGMDPYVLPAMKKVFPEKEFVELPFEHPIYHGKFDFKDGLPKVHEHDKKPPKGMGLLHEGRLVCFYGVESNISDGWESGPVHNNPESVRLASLRMGANIVQYAFGQ